MPVIRISDQDDPRIAAYVALRSARPHPGFHDARYQASRRLTTASGPYFITEGPLVTRRLLASDYSAESVLVDDDHADALLSQVGGDVVVYQVSATLMKQILGFDFHRGVMGCGLRKPIPDASNLVIDDSSRVVLALVGINQSENVGSMLRSASAMGVRDVVLGPGTVDPLCRRSLRVSMATALNLSFYSWPDPSAFDLQSCDASGRLRIVATTLDPDAIPIDQISGAQAPTVLIMGNEASGLSRSVSDAATVRARIPMRMGVDSLNVSVAAAIFLYELTRSTD
ncbi:MAG: RNA methyltransferase [Planctomycetota bacterium]